MPLVSPLLHLGTYVLMKYTKQRRFDEVLYELEQERQCVDEDLRRLTAAAAYLRTLLPHKRLISAFVLVVHGSVALPGTDISGILARLPGANAASRRDETKGGGGERPVRLMT